MKKILSTTLLAIVSLALYAVPAYRGTVKRTQPDGTTLHIRIEGDEHRHLITTTDGHPLKEDKDGWLRYAQLTHGRVDCIASSPAAHDVEMRSVEEKAFLQTFVPFGLNDLAPAVRAPQRIAEAGDMQVGSFPTKGQVRGLIILAQFSDVKFTTDAEYFERIMNEEGCTLSTPFGSARDYFRDQSMGQFSPTFDVVGPVSLNHIMGYYGGNSYMGSDQHPELMIRDACQKADTNLDIDFSQYDYDEDGKVDMVFVLYAGYGENYGASEDCIWPHKYELSKAGINLTLDGKTIDTYACACEIYGYTGVEPTGIGTFCHEFGHVLGLADHYDTTNGTRMMTGRYDIMDYGCYNDSTRTPAAYSAMERYSLGWMDLDELKEPALGLSMEDLKTSNQAYMLQSPNPDEYFILENRIQNGWDSYIPSQGMMITHVDYLKSEWARNTVNDGEHPRYCIVPADNDRTYGSDQRDLYPQTSNTQFGLNNNAFTGSSVPAAITWDGQWIDRDVTNIKLHADSTLTFDFRSESVGTPTALEATELYSNAFTAHWTEALQATSYELYVFRHDTLDTRPVALDEDFEKFSAGSYDSPDVTELSAIMDDYTTLPGWTGDRICQAGGWVRVGAPNANGTITTPALGMSASKGRFTLVIKARSYTGKQPTLTVTTETCSAKHRVSPTAKEYLYVFHSGTEATKVTLSISKERLYIDQLIIQRGDATSEYPDATVVNVTPEDTNNYDDLPEDLAFERVAIDTITDIPETQYTVKGLDTDCRYSYTVLACNGNAKSDMSNEVMVELFSSMPPMGIEEIHIDKPSFKDEQATLYNLQGQKVSRPEAGRLYIKDGKKLLIIEQ